MAFSSISSKASRFILTRATNLRTVNSFKVSSSLLSQTNRHLARSVWYLSSKNNSLGGSGIHSVVGNAVKNVKWPTKSCTCGCCGLHTEADQQLTNFLAEEIMIEKNSQKNPELPQIPGFSVSTDGSQVTLTRDVDSDKESVRVVFNVNHSVEFEQTPEAEESSEEPKGDLPDGQMRSYPDFTVELLKPGQLTLAVQCSFATDDTLDPDDTDDDATGDDLFLIDEIYLYDTKANETTYRVGSEVMQGEMYDHLLALLESRGVNNEFVEKLSDLASSFEHSSFITFLTSLKDTISS